jgi:hypothetical protein
MNEWMPAERRKREQPDLDERLSAYYGSALGEEPLAPAAWRDLRARLLPRRIPRAQWRKLWCRRHYTRNTPAPSFVVHAFQRVTEAARLRHDESLLAFAVKFRLSQPQVRVHPLTRPKLRLALPASAAYALEAAELDVLLASGLAQYLCMRKPAYVRGRLLAYVLLSLPWLTLLLLWLQHVPLLFFLIAIILCLGVCGVLLWLMHRQGRRMALQADDLVVSWLGRGHVCRGLHALAQRSRTPSRRRWSGLSLAERIANVCGSARPLQSERLILVR